PDGDHVGRRRRVPRPVAGAVVAGGGEDAHPGPVEVAVVTGLPGEFVDAEAVGDVAGVGGGVVLGDEHVGEPVAPGLDQEDVGPGGDGVHPLHVEGDLHRPELV